MKPESEIDRFEFLFEEYGDSLYRFCRRLTSNAAEAEDLVQETMVAALKGRSRFKGNSSIKTWLFQIAVYKARSFRANQRQVAELEALTGSDLETRITLDRAIESLPERLREAFVLVKAEQLTCAEAAEVLKIPVGTVKFHVYEAVRSLRMLLADCEWGGTKEKEPYAM